MSASTAAGCQYASADLTAAAQPPLRRLPCHSASRHSTVPVVKRGPLDAGRLPSSSGEKQMLRLAASLAGQAPVSLGEAVTGID